MSEWLDRDYMEMPFVMETVDELLISFFENNPTQMEIIKQKRRLKGKKLDVHYSIDKKLIPGNTIPSDGATIHVHLPIVGG